MDIALPKLQADWLEAQVADGTFASVDEAVAQIVAERMAFEDDEALGASDEEWAALIESLDSARADVAAGKFLTLDEHRARNAERLARIRDA